jgi:hypothetical protein
MADTLPEAYEPGAPQPDDVQYDTHLDVPLDDDTEPAADRKPVFVDAVVKQDTRLPIIPAGSAAWRTSSPR